MTNPKVSVIVVVEKGRDQLEAAMQSLFEQTYENWELIVVDFEPSERLKQIATTDSRVETLCLPIRCGLASSLNAGIGQASGEFIAFLDPAALWNPNKLFSQTDLFARVADLALCYTEVDYSGQTFDSSLFDNSQVRTFENEFETTVEDLCVGQAHVFKSKCADLDVAALVFLENQCIDRSTAMISRECLPYTGLFDPMLEHGAFCDMWVKIARKFRLGRVCSSLVSYSAEFCQGAMTPRDAFDHAEIYSKYVQYGTATANHRLVNYASKLLARSSHGARCHNFN